LIFKALFLQDTISYFCNMQFKFAKFFIYMQMFIAKIKMDLNTIQENVRMSLTEEIQELENKAYDSLSELIERALKRLAISDSSQKETGKPVITQLKKHWDIDGPSISRIRQKNLPKSEVSFIKAIDGLVLTNDEKKLALICHTTLRILADSHSQEQLDVAKIYYDMLEPLQLGNQVSVLDAPSVWKQVIENTLKYLDISEPTEQISPEVISKFYSSDVEKFSLSLLPYINTNYPNLYRQLKNRTISDITKAFKRSKEIITIDINNLKISEGIPENTEVDPPESNIPHWKTNFIPNVVLTYMELPPNVKLTDRRHRAIEFILITQGEGVFEIDKVGEVNISSDEICAVAHKADKTHSFKAGSKGAHLYIFSYTHPKANKQINREIIERMMTKTPQEIMHENHS